MTFLEWKRWVRSLPWSLRWFVLLVLVKPLLDVFWFVKDTSPFLSPLYIIGGLTPVLIGVSFFSKSFPKKHPSLLDLPFGIWGGLLCINALIILTGPLTSDLLATIFFLITPVFLFIFLRHLIRSKRDLHGIITTFFYSLLFPMGMILFENIFSPIATQTSRGLTRFYGAYGDIASYGAFFATGLLITCYFLIDNDSRLPAGKRMRNLIVVAVIVLVGLLSIHHAASWGVCAALVILFLLHSVGRKGLRLGRESAYALILVPMLMLGAFLFAGEDVSRSVQTLFKTEIEVVKGNSRTNSVLHGRVNRWNEMLRYWESTSFVSKSFGISFQTIPHWQEADVLPLSRMLGRATHGDYLRVFFATGLIGLIAWLLFLVGLLMKSRDFSNSERFLIRGALAIILLFSISMAATLVTSLQYFCFSVFAYAALPNQRKLIPSSRQRNRQRLKSQRGMTPA